VFFINEMMVRNVIMTAYAFFMVLSDFTHLHMLVLDRHLGRWVYYSTNPDLQA
jgi:hypothetical protein